MAGMRDPLTEAPPPCRFDPDELNSFAPTDPVDLTPPFIVWAPSVRGRLHSDKLSPQMLVLALSKVGIRLIHHLPNKTPIGSILLPGGSMVKNLVEPNPEDKTCFIYSCNPELSIILVSVNYSVPAERSNIWTKIVLQAFEAERVLVLEHTPIHHFRGKLSVDEPALFVLNTDQQKLEDKELGRPIGPYYPSGSLVDGLAAALLTHCQIWQMKGRLLLTWPDDSAMVKVLVTTLSNILQVVPQSVDVNFAEAGKKVTLKRYLLTNDLYI